MCRPVERFINPNAGFLAGFLKDAGFKEGNLLRVRLDFIVLHHMKWDAHLFPHTIASIDHNYLMGRHDL